MIWNLFLRYKENPIIPITIDDDKARGLHRVLQCVEPDRDSSNYPIPKVHIVCIITSLA